MSVTVFTPSLISSNVINRSIGWSYLYVEQVLKEYLPLVFRSLSIMLLLIPKDAFKLFLSMLGYDSDEQMGHHDPNQSNIEYNKDVPIESTLNEYANYVDDKKVKINYDDIEKLTRQGYDKSRYLSSSFLSRMDATIIGKGNGEAGSKKNKSKRGRKGK